MVRCQGRYIVLAGKSASGSPCFVTLDLSVDCEVNDLPLQDGQVVLSNRRRHRQFWVPAPDVEFGAYLARTIAKGRVDGVCGLRLISLYHQDPAAATSRLRDCGTPKAANSSSPRYVRGAGMR